METVKNDWIKPKMAVSLNRETQSKLAGYVKSLPLEAQPENLTAFIKMVLNGLPQPMETHVENPETAARLKKLEADHQALTDTLTARNQQIRELKTRIAQLESPRQEKETPAPAAQENNEPGKYFLWQ